MEILKCSKCGEELVEDHFTQHEVEGGYILLCDKCKHFADTEVYARIVGYVRPTNQWNAGKSEEYKDRKMFKTNEEKNS